ncbi:sphingoid long-chain bases kinase 1 [Aegilops tauschii subsp. strangulata]|uniref:DAGKc domain-containing protein n=1 Tax=Aegilops tauschii subsp. strangulata TaxID=200361 RepID=A0A453CJQ6_AEGTS|nr:sphingoid long-chain bases kinase 1 [Aegilops tauschii subsp. strangulata]XP_020200396.1 sphingoid long-chain bases kinase 1 [Aegilops tauschii subsp. strangulata]
MDAGDLENPTSRNSSQKSSRRSSSRRSQKSAGQQSSPTVFPEKRGKSRSLRQKHVAVDNKDAKKGKNHERRTDTVDERSNFVGFEVYSGKLFYDRKNKSIGADGHLSSNKKADTTDARLTSKALIWGSTVLSLEDVISVSYNSGLQHFTLHAYPAKNSLFGKTHRARKDFRFMASTLDEAILWVTCFAEQNIYINVLPHPATSSIKQDTDAPLGGVLFDYPPIKCRTPQRILVILNPRSGHGRSIKVFHEKAEPIFKLAGFHMEVVKTTHAGHAKSLASTFDFGAFPDGIVCVGGDGIVNEVFNGLLTRSDRTEAVSIPVGIIPAGSDNSLIWTVLGVKDPISASLLIVKGGFTTLDILAVEWLQSGLIHFGTTVSYYGFVSDVLELSEKYQKRFGPLRYFVAGVLKFLCLPSYFYELEYLPLSKDMSGHGKGTGQDKVELSDVYTDVMRSRSKREGFPRASSFSSIDSIMTPSRMSLGDFDTSGGTAASSEPSEYVRGLDPKAKRQSMGRSNIVSEPEEVLRPQQHHASYWPRTRSKTRTDRNSVGVIASNDTRLSWAAPSMHDKEDISSTISDPGPIWDNEPKWDTGPRWDTEPTWEPDHPIELPEAPEDIEIGTSMELVPNLDEKWVVRKGHFLGVLVCNHSCKTVQSSQIVAPNASHDDNSLDLLLVGGRGRWKLLRFFILLQFGRHLSLPYVEYVKVKSVKVKPGANTHNGCGIDGELCRVKGQVVCSMLPEQCRLIGRQCKQSI